MIDGEGNIELSGPLEKPDGRRYRNRGISIYNTDPDIMDKCIECCDLLGIPYRVYHIRNKTIFCLTIRTWRGLKAAKRLLNIQAVAKQVRLDDCLASYDPRFLKRQEA
jgi:hypothetical protein